MEMDENGQEEDSSSMCIHVYNLQTRLLKHFSARVPYLKYSTKKLFVIISSILPRMVHNTLPDA